MLKNILLTLYFLWVTFNFSDWNVPDLFRGEVDDFRRLRSSVADYLGFHEFEGYPLRPAFLKLILDSQKILDALVPPELGSGERWLCKIGIVLAIMEDIRGWGFEGLDSPKWMRDNYAALRRLFSGYALPAEVEISEDKLGRLFLKCREIRDTFKREQRLAYLGVQKAIINYYILNFIQERRPDIDLIHAPLERRHELFLRGVLNLHFLRGRNSGEDLIPHGYVPDLAVLSDLPNLEEEINEYLLSRFIQFELLGYAQCLLAERERRRLGLDYDDEGFLNTFLKKLHSPEYENFYREFFERHYPELRRLLWSVFNFRYYQHPDTPLINLLTIAEAEYLARRIIHLYFINHPELAGSPIKSDFNTSDPFYYLNWEKNKYAYQAWAYIEGNVGKIKGKYIRDPNSPMCKKEIIRYLLKILTISGAFDLSVDTIRERVHREGFEVIIEDCLDPRRHPFVVSSLNKFLEEVILDTKRRTKLVIFADNNGEIIYLLGLIKYLLEFNPNLSVFLVPRGSPAADDVYYDMLCQILEKDKRGGVWGEGYFEELVRQIDFFDSHPGKRFYIVSNASDFQGVDLRHLEAPLERAFFSNFSHVGRNGRTVLFDRTVILLIGNANFVSTQGLNMERYYLYRVKAQRVSRASGIPTKPRFYPIEYPLVFAYVEPGICIGTQFGPSDKIYSTLLEYEYRNPHYFDPLMGFISGLKERWRSGK